MHGLRDALEQSQKDRVAIGHFNVGDWVLLKAVLASGQELKVPVLVVRAGRFALKDTFFRNNVTSSRCRRSGSAMLCALTARSSLI